jgi:Glycosyl transferases group 1/DUF based on E. rectale Gene description (DUF3880)
MANGFDLQLNELDTLGKQSRLSYMRFGLIYDSTDSHITSRYLRQALPQSQSIHFDLNALRPNVDIDQLVGAAGERGVIPDVILYETGAPGLPRGFNRVSLPTAILDIDTFGWTPFRLRWAMLFDYVFTWHPSYVLQFQEAGHPRVFALPHAVDAQLFGESIVDAERLYDIGFVGNRGLTQYRRRDRVISKLASRFRTNDFKQSYNKEELAEVYRRSRITVNVSRSEFPQEANMRCYEAMAAGALLMTGIPTELTEWGFREGEHFIGWRSEEEIPDLVDQFLRHKEQRLAIARAGQERTLKDFTYQRCVESMVETIARDNGQLFAPARQWPPEEVHLLYLSYYYRFQIPCAALEEFQLLRRANPRAYWRGLPMVLKTLRHVVRCSLM